MAVANDSLRPYSQQYWLERQRQFRLEQMQRRRFRRAVGALAAFVIISALVAAVTWILPDGWDDKLRQQGTDWIRDN